MRDLLEWLLDLDAIRLGEGTLSLRWQWAWPTWAVVLVAALLIAWSVLIYRREGGSSWGRRVGAVLRVMVLLLTFILLLQPVLLLQRVRVEPSEVALLVDDSASMGVTERSPAATPSPATTTATGGEGGSPAGEGKATSSAQRAERLVRALSSNEWAALRSLASKGRLSLYSFAERARLQAPPTSPDDLGPVTDWLDDLRPDGARTDLVRSVLDVLDEPRSGRLAGVVVASDGRSNVAGELDSVIEAAREKQVPIHVILAGSEERRVDVSVGPTLAEESVFVRDLLAVRTSVSADGLSEPTPIDVRLVDPEGNVLTRERATLGGETTGTEVELRHRPSRAGRLRLRVEVEPIAGETNPNNNADFVEVEVLDERIRVLFVDGYPRYEYRFLANMLFREETITSSCLLLSADEAFVQEGNEPIQRFPASMDELLRFDVVILGDVNPRGDWISPRQMERLVAWVGDRGGALLFVAGPTWTPHAFLGTPLEKLIPVRIDPSLAGQTRTSLITAFQVQLTPEGRTSSIFRFETDPAENERTLASLPGTFWFAKTLGAAPGAEVLAQHPTVRTVEGAAPLLVVGRYGIGNTGFSAVEETWRWRREVGNRLFDVYWLQLIRRLTRSQFLGRDRRFTLHTERATYELGQPVVVTLTVRDKSELAALPSEMTAEVVDVDGRVVDRVRLVRIGQASNTYEGTFLPRGDGAWSVRLASAFVRAGLRPPSAVVRIEARGPERRQIAPDHDALRRLAQATGGVAVAVGDIGDLAGRLEDRSVRIPDDVSEPLWDSKLVLVLFVLIITMEWVWRKAVGLV